VYKLFVMLHLLGASIWIGGHVLLATTVLPRALRSKNPAVVLEFEAGYERIGLLALVLQIVTGVWLAYHWLPDAGTWFAFESPLSHLVAGKLVLLALTLGVAVHARLRLIPKLAPDNLRALAWHVAAVTVLSLLFLVAGVGIRTGGL